MAKVQPFLSIIRFLIINVRLFTTLFPQVCFMNQTMAITGNLPEMQYLTPQPSFNQNLLLHKPLGDLRAYFSMGSAAPQSSTGSHYQCTSGSPGRDDGSHAMSDTLMQPLWRSCFDSEFDKSWKQAIFNVWNRYVFAANPSYKPYPIFETHHPSASTGSPKEMRMRDTYEWRRESGVLCIKLGKNHMLHSFYILLWQFLCSVCDPQSSKLAKPEFLATLDIMHVTSKKYSLSFASRIIQLWGIFTFALPQWA